MIWVAWRVQRQQYLVALGVVAILALWLAVSGLAASSSWAQTTNHGFDVVLYVLPGVLGLALGAPLVAGEIDQGTNRLAWSQSVTKTRWLGHKMLVGALVSVVLVGALAPLVGWWTGVRWSTPYGLTQPVLYVYPKIFGITGVLSIGYVLLAFLLGAALGAVIRRPGWAFAVGKPIVVAIRLLVDGLRPTLVTPAVAVAPSSPVAVQQVGYVLHSALLPIGQTSPALGQTWSGAELSRIGAMRCIDHCTRFLQGDGPAFVERQLRCATAAHLHLVVQYQPESHFWPLQGAETAIFLGVALVLLVVTFVSVRRWRA